MRMWDPWPHLVGYGYSVSTHCGVGHRHGSDPMLLWLWCRLRFSPCPKNFHMLQCSPQKEKRKKKKKKILQTLHLQQLFSNVLVNSVKWLPTPPASICHGKTKTITHTQKNRIWYQWKKFQINLQDTLLKKTVELNKWRNQSQPKALFFKEPFWQFYTMI